MMTLFPASALLVDLHSLGIEVQSHGNAIRFRPQLRMTPALLQRLQENKAGLLTLLDTASAVAELRRFVAALWKDSRWLSAWEQRLRDGNHADLNAVKRVQELVIDQAEEHHRRRDWTAFASACKYLQRLTSGEEWENAERLHGDDRWDIPLDDECTISGS